MNSQKTRKSWVLVESSTLENARFDWYTATMKRDAWRVAAVLAQRPESSGGSFDVVPGRGRWHYDHGLRVGVESYTFCDVLYGGQNEGCCVVASSWGCDQAVPRIRKLWPDSHEATRLDSALDIDAGDRTFQRLVRIGLDVADRYGLETSHAGDWHRGIKGRTLYLGSKSSESFTRIYEKGKQMRLKVPTPDAEEYYSENWVRVEKVYRVPKGPARNIAASVDAATMWGFHEWTHELVSRIYRVAVPFVANEKQRISDEDRAYWWALKQYGKNFLRREARLGTAIIMPGMRNDLADLATSKFRHKLRDALTTGGRYAKVG
jgi:hypothetical protein